MAPRKSIKRTRISRKSRKTISKLRDELWSILAPAIRERDGDVCISCGASRLYGRNRQAGHLFSAGGHSNTRYHPLNISVQCARCNIFLRGNHAEYAAAFIKKFGLDFFNAMAEASKPTKKWTIAEIEDLIAKAKLGLDHYTGYYCSLYGPEH